MLGGLLDSLISHTQLLPEMQKKLSMTQIFVHWFCPDFEWIRTYALLIYTHQQELMKAMGRTMAAARHCSLVFMMKKKVMGSLTCCLQLS
jgi:hypothetical protein